MYSILSALLIVAVVVVLIYGPNPFRKSENETPEISPETNVETALFQPMPRLAAESEPKPNVIDVAPSPGAKPNPKVAELIAETMEIVKTEPGGIIEARDTLNDALRMPMSKQQRAFVKDQLSKLTDQWLFSPIVFANDMLCDIYKVKPGNQLRTVGERYKVPWEILKEINRIQRPELLPAGKVIKVINGPFRAKIYRSTFTLDLYLQNTFVRSFPVGLGKPGNETPTGLWRVKPGGKLVKPPWWDEETGRTYQHDDPDYPLGSRWIELEGIGGVAKGREGFGIHGTKDPDQIGKAESRGCIRLHNGDAILIYNLLVPIFSKVEVLD
jgi:lipoprotein-anchoring transpeptidase ErfK/SrfK